MDPTLLIGLGGIGSRIVNEVYGRVPLEHRRRLAVQIFDTDTNDIGRLKHLSAKHVVQTSTPDTVGRYLERADASVLDWFPHEIQEIRHKVLSKGAGQVRAVSRLAYRSAMQAGKLDSFQRALNEIFTIAGDSLQSALRVMVISSLGGGTGSGIFIQTALYLRWLFERQSYTPLIQGMFLLPEVLVDTGVLPRDLNNAQQNNVEANAYACLKEVNQILLLSQGMGNEIDLEFRPDQVDLEGRLNHAIGRGTQLYDTIQLVGYKNAEKPSKNLRTLDDYLAQMADSVYLNLFTPVGTALTSSEDNHLIALAENRGLNRYGSCGVASVEYPYEDMLRYCSLRWMTDSISGEWLRLDEFFNRELEQYEQNAMNGIVQGEKPDLRRRYVELLALEGDPDRSGSHFFRQCFKETHIMDAEGYVVESKASVYLNELGKEIRLQLDKQAKIQEFEQKASPVIEELSSKDDAANHVAAVERALQNLEREIESKIPTVAGYVVQRAIFSDRSAPQGMEGGDERLNTWVLGKDAPMHPVAARAMIYEVHNRIADHLAALRNTNTQAQKEIKKYADAYDRTGTGSESAVGRVHEAAGKWFNKSLKAFAEEYWDKATRQLRRLKNYKTSLLEEQVYQKILTALRTLLEEIEDFFIGLKSINLSLLDEKNSLAELHDRPGDPSRYYVLASRKMKEEVWKHFGGQAAQLNSFPEELSRELYIQFYSRFCQKELEKKFIGNEERPANIFRKSILDWCEKTLRESGRVNFTIVEALQQEASFMGEKNDAYTKDLVYRVNRSSQPFSSGIADKGQTNRYWAVHPECRQGLEAALEDTDKASVISDPVFSPYMLLRYASCLGLNLSDFTQFSDGQNLREPGRYFRAYHTRIRELSGGTATSVSPHLDKRWHLPAYMADINAGRAQQDRRQMEEAFILGLIYRYYSLENFDGKSVWNHRGIGRYALLKAEGQPVPAGLLALWRALGRNPAVVDHVLDDALKEQEENLRNFARTDQIDRHTFYRSCCEPHPSMGDRGRNILDLILAIPQERPRENLIPETRTILEALIRVVLDYYGAVFGSHQPGLAKTAALELLQRLRDESEALKTMDQRSALYTALDVLYSRLQRGV